MKKDPDYSGHRERSRRKYRKEGISAFHDYEVLEMLLFHCIPRKDTKPIAKNLLRKFKTLGRVLNAEESELEKTEGVSETTCAFLHMIKDVSELCHREELEDRDLLNSPRLVAEYLKSSLKYSPDEEFKVLFLNTRNRLIEAETLHTGTVNRSVVYPRKVVERALHCRAASVILSHNHPAGSLSPSPDDISATKSIRRALETVEINLLDHVIIGGNGHFSFAENGIDY